MLDLWQNDTDVTAAPQPTEARDLPTTFGENFEASWNEGRLFTQSIAGENARLGALSDHIDDIKAKTGKDIASQIDWASLAGADNITSDMMRDQVNAASAKLDVPELSADDLEQKAVDKSRAAQTAYATMAAREKGPGGGLGEFLGGAAAQATDPMNLAALPLAPETGGVGILAAALRWGAVAGVSQAAIEAAGGAYHEEVQPGYLESGAPLENIATAAGQGMLLGGGTRALANAWTRVKTGAWPQSVRDAGNVVESDANIAATNVYPGVEGEVAHREAMQASIDNILKGMPVDVSEIITPELETQARGIVARLEGERAMSLPIFDERAIRLTSEEAGLREQDAGLASQLEGLPAGDFSAADRLNRLQAVEQQLATTTDVATGRALNARRDQILVDTTPEALRAGAAPIEQRRQIGAQRGQIASRLSEIEAERNQVSLENAQRAPVAMGQTMPVRSTAEAQTVQAAVAQAAKRPIVETPMPSGANSTKDLNGPVYVDPRVPEPLRRPVAVHETVEQTLMQQGMPYERAHVIATAAERQAVEAAGMDWEKYTHEWDGLLATIEHERPGNYPPGLHVNPEAAIGHHANKGGRAVPAEAIRAHAAETAGAAEAARASTGESQPGLPFEATAAEGAAQTAHDALSSGVAQIARRAGYDMPADEAAAIAARLVKATPEEASDTLRDLQISPRQVAEAPVRAAAEPKAPEPVNVQPADQVVGTPDHDAAMRADIDRERMTGDRQIPVGVDAEGNAIMRSLDGAMDEVDAMKNAADQIQACAAPAPEPTEEAA